MGRRTETRIDRATVRCARSARRSIAALLVFYCWLAATALGPVLSTEGWSLATTGAGLLGYSALTVLALVLLFRATSIVFRSPDLRQVVSGRLAPFWILGFLGFIAGTLVFGAISGADLGGAGSLSSLVYPSALLYGLSTAAAVILSGFALAQIAHLRELRGDRALVSHSPDASDRPASPIPLTKVARDSLVG